MDILKAEIARKRKLVEDKQLVDDTKRFFKRSDLARKEQEDYFRRCGYKVDVSITFYLFLSNSLRIIEIPAFHQFYHVFSMIAKNTVVKLFLQENRMRSGIDAQVYISVCICVYCAVFPQPASAACICRFRERLPRARYGIAQ